MRQQDGLIGIIVTLVEASSIACGALMCLALWVLAKTLGCVFTYDMYFYAYLTGSVGFMLTAPVSIIKPIHYKYSDDIFKFITVWSINTIAIFLLACMVGVIFIFAQKWLSADSSTISIAVNFLSGTFILFVSGGIHWFAYRRKKIN